MAAISALLLFSTLLMPCDAAAADPPTPAVADPLPSTAHSRAADAGVSGVVPADLWCVAKNNAEDAPLQAALDWACGQGGADCRPIQQGGACFRPNDLLFHASYAFNDYYLRNGVSPQACDFGGTAALTSLDPGNKNCHFPSSSSARNGSFTGAAASSSTGLGPSVADVSGGYRRAGAGGAPWWPCRLSMPLLVALAASA